MTNFNLKHEKTQLVLEKCQISVKFCLFKISSKHTYKSCKTFKAIDLKNHLKKKTTNELFFYFTFAKNYCTSLFLLTSAFERCNNLFSINISTVICVIFFLIIDYKLNFEFDQKQYSDSEVLKLRKIVAGQ